MTMRTGRHTKQARQVNALFLLIVTVMGGGLLLDQFGLLPKVHVGGFGSFNAAAVGSVEPRSP